MYGEDFRCQVQEQENKRRVYGRVREEGGEVEEVALHLIVLARQEEVHGRQRVGHRRQRVRPSPREKSGRCNCLFFCGSSGQDLQEKMARVQGVNYRSDLTTLQGVQV